MVSGGGVRCRLRLPLTPTLSPLAGRGGSERLIDEFCDGEAIGEF